MAGAGASSPLSIERHITEEDFYDVDPRDLREMYEEIFNLLTVPTDIKRTRDIRYAFQSEGREVGADLEGLLNILEEIYDASFIGQLDLDGATPKEKVVFLKNYLIRTYLSEYRPFFEEGKLGIRDEYANEMAINMVAHVYGLSRASNFHFEIKDYEKAYLSVSSRRDPQLFPRNFIGFDQEKVRSRFLEILETIQEPLNEWQKLYDELIETFGPLGSRLTLLEGDSFEEFIQKSEEIVEITQSLFDPYSTDDFEPEDTHVDREEYLVHSTLYIVLAMKSLDDLISMDRGKSVVFVKKYFDRLELMQIKLVQNALLEDINSYVEAEGYVVSMLHGTPVLEIIHNENGAKIIQFPSRVSEGGPNLDGNSSPLSTKEDLGGIDMNDIPVDRQGGGVEIHFDPVQLQQIIDLGIDGFVPVIINFVPLPSVLPLLGLAPKKEEDYELSSLN